MSQAEPTLADRARALTIHNAPGARHNVAPPIERAFGLLGLHGKRRELMALFGKRITRGAVLHWRKGRRSAPAWALDTVARELDSQIAERAHVASELRAELEKRNTKP